MTDNRPSLEQWALDMCEHVALRSRDPSTRVGAVILRPDKTVASVGYNGFPRGVADLPERYADRATKLRMTVHAEANAIAVAAEPLDVCTIYVSPLFPCAQCAALIIQKGIKRVVARAPAPIPARWREDMDIADTMFREAGVHVTIEHTKPEARDLF